MGFLDNFLGRINLNGEGDEAENEYEGFEDELDELDEEDEVEEDVDTTTDSVSRADSKKVDSADEDEDNHRRKSARSTNSKVVQMRTAGGIKQSEVCMILPKGYEESQRIADLLLQGKTVVLNMEGMNMDVAQRIIDFVSGACFTMEGNLQKISKKIFIATPKSVELSGGFDLMGENVDIASLNLTL